MNITIINAHSWLNKGDAALVITAIDFAKAIEPSAKITIISDTPEIDSNKYAPYLVIGTGMNFRGRFHRIKRVITLARMMFNILLSKMPMFGNYIKETNDDLNKIFRIISKSDYVLSCGGGYFNPYGKLMYRTMLMHLAISFGSKTILLPNSIENPKKMHLIKKMYFEYVLKKIGMVYSRESITTEYLGKLNHKNYKVKADMGFMLKGNVEKFLNTSKYIALTIINWQFPDSDNSSESRNHYFGEWIKIINHLTDVLNYKIIVIPQVIGPGVNDDRISWQFIGNSVDKNKVQFVDKDLSPEEIKNLLSECKILIGTRMHSNIFALSLKIPVIAVAYLPKTIGIMNDLNLQDLSIDMPEFSCASVISKVETIENNYENYVHRIDNEIKKLDLICADEVR